MVLVLLSSINPFSPSTASPRSPHSVASPAPSSFFAVLSPLFDYNGSEDDQSQSTPTTPGSASQFPDACSVTSGSPAFPSLLPPPLRFRPHGNNPKPLSSVLGSPKDKVLPALPMSPALSSPFAPSPLRMAHAVRRHYSESMPRSTPERPHFGSVPEVHISTPANSTGSYTRRRPAPLDTSRLSPAFGPRRSAGLLAPETPAPLSSAISDCFPSPTSSYGPTTPRTAEFVPMMLSTQPAPFSPREIWGGNTDSEDDGCSMLVPLAIELPAAEHIFAFPPLEAPKQGVLRRPGMLGERGLTQ